MKTSRRKFLVGALATKIPAEPASPAPSAARTAPTLAEADGVYLRDLPANS
jgi:hypothetical protein